MSKHGETFSYYFAEEANTFWRPRRRTRPRRTESRTLGKAFDGRITHSFAKLSKCTKLASALQHTHDTHESKASSSSHILFTGEFLCMPGRKCRATTRKTTTTTTTMYDARHLTLTQLCPGPSSVALLLAYKVRRGARLRHTELYLSTHANTMANTRLIRTLQQRDDDDDISFVCTCVRVNDVRVRVEQRFGGHPGHHENTSGEQKRMCVLCTIGKQETRSQLKRRTLCSHKGIHGEITTPPLALNHMYTMLVLHVHKHTHSGRSLRHMSHTTVFCAATLHPRVCSESESFYVIFHYTTTHGDNRNVTKA